MQALLLLEALLIGALIDPVYSCFGSCCCPPAKPSCGCASTCGGG
uniref:Uncharacterized protein n=1 Tax=Elaeophora elaphi TaxID=1147741 RepID=A0A0R3RNT7_9BILA